VNGIIYYVYHIESGKGYVGRHCRDDLYARFHAHSRPRVKTHLAHSIRKYGEESFKVVLLDRGVTDEELNDKEIFWIEELSTLHPNGFNLLPGGQGYSGWKSSEATREAQSISRFGVLRGPHSDATKKKISDKKTGNTYNRVVTEAQVIAIRNSPGKTDQEWAREVMITSQAIRKIRLFKSFKNEGRQPWQNTTV